MLTPLPRTTSVSHAAALAGRSRAAFVRRYIDTGLVKTVYSLGGRQTVIVASLQEAIGRRIGAEEWLAAEGKLERSRAYQRQYRSRGAEGQQGKSRASPAT